MVIHEKVWSIWSICDEWWNNQWATTGLRPHSLFLVFKAKNLCVLIDRNVSITPPSSKPTTIQTRWYPLECNSSDTKEEPWHRCKCIKCCIKATRVPWKCVSREVNGPIMKNGESTINEGIFKKNIMIFHTPSAMTAAAVVVTPYQSR